MVRKHTLLTLIRPVFSISLQAGEDGVGGWDGICPEDFLSFYDLIFHPNMVSHESWHLYTPIKTLSNIL